MTTGFSKSNARQLAVWDARNLKSAAHMERIDSGSSPLIPVADADAGLVFLLSRGDQTVRVYEHVNSKPHLHSIVSTQLSGNPTWDCIGMPKAALDVRGCEVARLMWLCRGMIQPVRVEALRKEKNILLQTSSGHAGASPSGEAASYFGGEEIPASARVHKEAISAAKSSAAPKARVESAADDAGGQNGSSGHKRPARRQ